MSYYQSSGVTYYNPMSRPISLCDNLYAGMEVRFSHPDYSTQLGKFSIENLKLNKTYVVRDYMVYSDGVVLYLSQFPGIKFDSKLFTLIGNNFIIPFGKRRIKFLKEKLKLKFSKLCC